MTEQVDQSFKNYPKDPNGIMGFQPNKDLTTPENMSKENRQRNRKDLTVSFTDDLPHRKRKDGEY